MGREWLGSFSVPPEKCEGGSHARLSSHSTGANSSNSRYKSPGKKRLRRLPNGNESRLHLETREGCRHSIQLFCCIALKSQICQFCLNNLFTPDVPAPGPPMRLQRTRAEDGSTFLHTTGAKRYLKSDNTGVFLVFWEVQQDSRLCRASILRRHNLPHVISLISLCCTNGVPGSRGHITQVVIIELDPPPPLPALYSKGFFCGRMHQNLTIWRRMQSFFQTRHLTCK